MVKGPAPVARPPDPSDGGSLSPADIAFINSLLDRMKEAYRRFRIELIVYNISCVIALGLVVYSAVRTAMVHADATALGVYFTSGGLFAGTGYQITKFLTGDLKTLNSIIDRILAGRAGHG